MKLIGIDVGGTKTETALLEVSDNDPSKFKILVRKRIPTHRERGYKNMVEATTTLVWKTLKEAKLAVSKLDGLGIGLPGTVRPDTGKMVFGNTMALIDQPFGNDLKSELNLKCPTYAENDANCFAFAEVMYGAGLKHAQEFKKNPKDCVGIGVILGTGVGGGIVIKGKLLQGRNGGAGEIGHTELFPGGLSCYCGRNGCAENYLSGPALEAHFRRRMYSQIPEAPDAAGIFDLLRKRDPIATAVVEQYQRDIARFIGNLSNIFDPDFFVFGGGMSNSVEIYNNLREHILEHSFLGRSKRVSSSVTSSQKEKGKPDFIPKVYQNALGDSAGVVGAALLAVQN